MTIIFNTDQIYLHGGIEKVVATKANFFANRKDVDVVIVTTEQYDHVPCYPLDSKIKLIDLGINYDRAKSYFSLENIKKAFLHYRKQKQLFKTLKPDAIISPNYNFDHYWLPLIKGKARLIKERHSSGFFKEENRKKTSFFQRLKLRFDDWIDSLYTHIVILNPDEKKYVKSNNAIVIPNPIESSDLNADMSQKQVVAAGRLSPVKAFDELIDAWLLLVDDFPDWQLHIYGQDYLGTQEKLEKLIANKHLTKKIILKGSVDDMPSVMTNYSIYAMSSVTECFPMVLLEALSVGLPIVSYDCPNVYVFKRKCTFS
ncbi:glycosyltransferase [Chryseobacterium sp. T1]